MPFIVDTGAAFTFLSATDAMRYLNVPRAGLDSNNWTDAISVDGMGGKLRGRSTSALYGFRHGDRVVESIPGPMLVGDINSDGLPSLLGWDLLKYFRLDIHGGNQTIVLHRM